MYLTQGCHKSSICKKHTYLQSAIKWGMPVYKAKLDTTKREIVGNFYELLLVSE